MTSDVAFDFLAQSRSRHESEHRELVHRQRRVPPIPDLRFEWSYFRSIRPYVHLERSQTFIPRSSDEKGKGIAVDFEEEQQDVVANEDIRIQWGQILWVTTKDQILSPFLQGTAWCVSLSFLRRLHTNSPINTGELQAIS